MTKPRRHRPLSSTSIDTTPIRPPAYTRTRGAAQYLGVTENRLGKLRVMGVGPPFSYLLGQVIYSYDDLDGYLAANKRTNTLDSLKAWHKHKRGRKPKPPALPTTADEPIVPPIPEQG